MNKSIKYLIISIGVLLVITISVSFAYFVPNFINNTKDTKVSTGNLDLVIDDESINEVEISPIYDNDYELMGIHKNFTVISKSSLNSCANLYINVSEISDSLKSKYFKYKLKYDGRLVEGNFENANNNEKMLLINNVFLESLSEKSFDLYIWVSYDENVDQTNMLKGQIKSKDAILEEIQNEQNYLNIIYQKIIKQIEAFEELFSKMKAQVDKLFNWNEGIKKDLLIFCPKLTDDFYISKNTIYTYPMENYSNFIHNKIDPITQHFLKVLPELDYSFKLINKIYIDNISTIESLTYYILKKSLSNNENQIKLIRIFFLFRRIQY